MATNVFVRLAHTYGNTSPPGPQKASEAQRLSPGFKSCGLSSLLPARVPIVRAVKAHRSSSRSGAPRLVSSQPIDMRHHSN